MLDSSKIRKGERISTSRERTGSPLVALHSKPHLLVPSSKLCQNWLCRRRGTLYLHAAFHQCCHCQCQHATKGFGTNKTGSNITLKQRQNNEAHPPQIEKWVLFQFKQFWFYSWERNAWVILTDSDTIWVVCKKTYCYFRDLWCNQLW